MAMNTHEAMLLMKFLRRKPQINYEILNQNNLFYTIIYPMREKIEAEQSLQAFYPR